MSDIETRHSRVLFSDPGQYRQGAAIINELFPGNDFPVVKHAEGVGFVIEEGKLPDLSQALSSIPHKTLVAVPREHFTPDRIVRSER